MYTMYTPWKLRQLLSAVVLHVSLCLVEGQRNQKIKKIGVAYGFDQTVGINAADLQPWQLLNKA